MMDQLGIKALRPGPSGDEKAPNHANYDESKANPYPNIPDPLTLNNGEKVTTAAMWWDKRRPELVEMFEKEVYGRVPKNRAQGHVDRHRRRSRDSSASIRSSPRISSARSTTRPIRRST